MLASAAEMPPCAATVCERVGNTLVMQAVCRPLAARPKVARRPATPAPTTTMSYLCSVILYALFASGVVMAGSGSEGDAADGHDGGERGERAGELDHDLQGELLPAVHVILDHHLQAELRVPEQHQHE